VSVGEKIIK